MNLDAPPLRLMSLVEGGSVTGPIKPLLLFSRRTRPFGGTHRRIEHELLATRRRATGLHEPDELELAAMDAGMSFVPIPERRAGDPFVVLRLLSKIRAFAPDILETHGSKSHFLLLLARTLSPSTRRIPWVAFHHGYTRTSARVTLYQQLDRLSLRFADTVITVCRPFVDLLTARGVRRGRLSVLTNAVEPQPAASTSDVASLRKSLALAETDCVILAVGRLSEEKGHADLIEAFGRLDEPATENWFLVLAGDGPERAHLERLAAPLGKRIKFLGHVRDIRAVYGLADVFALPSHSEGSPLVLFEAIAAGLPILATKVGGVPEVVTDGESALLVPAQDVDALAVALLKLIVDPEQRLALGRAAHAVVSTHSVDRYTERLLGIYDRTLGGKAGH